MLEDDKCFKYFMIVIAIAIVTIGVYKTTKLAFDRLDHLQEISRQVIEK